MLRLFHRLVQFTLRLIFWLSAAVVGMGLLAVALVAVVFSLLKSLITGRPSVALSLVLGGFRRFSPQGWWPADRPETSVRGQRPASVVKRPAGAARDVVDVEVREIPDEKRQH